LPPAQSTATLCTSPTPAQQLTWINIFTLSQVDNVTCPVHRRGVHRSPTPAHQHITTSVSELRQYISSFQRSLSLETGDSTNSVVKLENTLGNEYLKDRSNNARFFLIGKGLKLYDQLWYSRMIFLPVLQAANILENVL